MTVSVVRFFREVFNEGTDSEFIYAGFDIDVENKMKGYFIELIPDNCSLADKRVIDFASLSNGEIDEGKIATLSFVKSDAHGGDGDFENLESLYELEGNFKLIVTDGQYSYPDLGGELSFSIPDHMGSDAEKYNRALDLQSSGDYVSATQIFRDLGDFEDAVERKVECAALAVRDYVQSNATGIAMTEETAGKFQLIYNTAISENVQDYEKAFIAINGKNQLCIGDYFESGSVISGYYLGQYCVLILNDESDDVSVNCVDIVTIQDGVTFNLFAYDDTRSSLAPDAELKPDAEVTQIITPVNSDEMTQTTVSLAECSSSGSLNARYQAAITYADILLQKMGLTVSDLGLGE